MLGGLTFGRGGLEGRVERGEWGVTAKGTVGPGLVVVGAADAIRTAAQEVMRVPTYAAAAENRAAVMEAAPGAAGAAIDLERLALTGHMSPV